MVINWHLLQWMRRQQVLGMYLTSVCAFLQDFEDIRSRANPGALLTDCVQVASSVQPYLSPAADQC